MRRARGENRRADDKIKPNQVRKMGIDACARDKVTQQKSLERPSRYHLDLLACLDINDTVCRLSYLIYFLMRGGRRTKLVLQGCQK
jgi:hypothetical protein